jgi:hypothetical protein
MAYVSGKDGAHTQDLGATNRASERMPNLKLSFFLGCKIDLHQSGRQIRTPAFHWSIFAALQQSCCN